MAPISGPDFPCFIGSSLSSNTYKRGTELGDSTTAERDQRSVVDEALDKLKDDLAELVKAVETGGLDHLDADQQLTVWQRFERLGNKLLLCRYHHTHFLQNGWSCRINDDGLPEWIPPRWIDQDQRPHINTRIRRIHTQQRLHRRNQQRRTPTAA
jgi:hypothetical protein